MENEFFGLLRLTVPSFKSRIYGVSTGPFLLIRQREAE